MTEDVVGRLPSEAKDLLQAAGEFAHDLPQEAGDLLNEAVALGRFALQGPASPGRPEDVPLAVGTSGHQLLAGRSSVAKRSSTSESVWSNGTSGCHPVRARMRLGSPV